MTAFWLGAGALLLAALVLLLVPVLRGRRAQAEEARTALNVARYQERIAELSASLAGSLERDSASADLQPHLQAIEQADLLLVGSPVYRASYTGLFKHLFDLVDHQSLKGVPVVLAATGGSERHALMIDHQLRPLFAFFQAHTLPYGLYASVESFDDQRLADPAQFERIERVLDTVGAFFHIPVARAA